jgi:hypothetical protein
VGGCGYRRGWPLGGDLAAVPTRGTDAIVTYALTAEGLSPRGEIAVSQVTYPIAVAVLASKEILALTERPAASRA